MFKWTLGDFVELSAIGLFVFALYILVDFIINGQTAIVLG